MAEAIEIGVREARSNFSHYLRQARAGVAVRITSRGAPVVELRVVAEAPKPREPGWLIGTEWEHFEPVEWTDAELAQMFGKPLD